ncbi:CoA-ligase, partial [Musa troglodytarum]
MADAVTVNIQDPIHIGFYFVHLNLNKNRRKNGFRSHTKVKDRGWALSERWGGQGRRAHLLRHGGVGAGGKEEGLGGLVGHLILSTAEAGGLHGHGGYEGPTHGGQRPHLGGREAMAVASLLRSSASSQQRVASPPLHA